MDTKKLEQKIKEALKEIPTPAPGRDLALVVTKLQEALLWLKSKEIL